MIFKKSFKTPYLWFAIIAFIVVLLQNYIGVKFSYDSNWYIIFTNRVGESLDFTRHAVYAPLYSWSLGAFVLLGFNIITSILIYWWVAYFLILVVFYLLSKKFLFSILAFVAIFSNLSVSSLFRFAWTELGYSVILICAVLSLYKLIESENKKFKILFLLAIAILPLQRYIGGFISLYLGLIYLFISKRNIIRRGIELFLTVIPIALIIIWNFSISGHFSGDRKGATFSVWENLNQTKSVLFHNFSPEWLLYLGAFACLFNLVRLKRVSPILLFLFFIPFIQVLAQLYGSSTYFLFYITPRFFIVLTPLIILLLMIFFKEVFKTNDAYHKYSILAMFFLLVSTNLVALNNRHRLTKELPKFSYEKVKHYVSKIPEHETVGVYSKNTVCRQAEYILTSKIIPEGHCKDYKVLGDNRTEDIRYMPMCDNLKGHKYIPINDYFRDKPNFLIIDKERLKRGWKDIFKGYKIEDLGSFYGLSK